MGCVTQVCGRRIVGLVFLLFTLFNSNKVTFMDCHQRLSEGYEWISGGWQELGGKIASLLQADGVAHQPIPVYPFRIIIVYAYPT
jgi:hypothetical protein